MSAHSEKDPGIIFRRIIPLTTLMWFYNDTILINHLKHKFNFY